MKLEDKLNLQNEMNQTLRCLGLDGWSVIFMPGKKHEVNGRVLEGQVIPDEKTILIFNEDPEKAKATLIHEFIEIKIQPLIAAHQEATNAQIKAIERLLYREKERMIKEMTPLLRHFFEEKQHASTDDNI